MFIIGVVGHYVLKTLGTKTMKNTYLEEVMILDEKNYIFPSSIEK